MAHYLNGVESCLAKLSYWRVKCIPHEENGEAEALVGVVATLPITESIMLSVYVHDVVHIGIGMHPIANYPCIGEVSNDGKQTYKLCIQVARFTLINDQLYKRFFRGPYLKCLINLKAQYVLDELHEGECENHPGGRTLAYRAYS
ncbi:hypothetical protein AAG906_013142 [Vitis piasezkii]